MMDYFYLFLAGLGGGFMAGLLGIGGGIFYLLVLPFALTRIGVNDQEIVQYVIANSLFGTLFAALSGSLTQMRNGTFYLRPVLWVSLGAITISLLTINFFVNTPFYSKQVFNIVVIALLVFILWRTLRKSAIAKGKKGGDKGKTPSPRWFMGAGGSGGLVAALSGLGGGAIVVPFLTLILGMDIKKAKSISLGMIFFTSLMITCFNMTEVPRFNVDYYNMGYIVFPIVLPLGMGVVISSPLGVKAAAKMSSRLITILFSIFIFVVILKKAFELIPG
ncbi:MAG: sulfite exporter TauE/SafE family protein [Bacteroidota bacterium]